MSDSAAGGRTESKRRAVLEAATEVFLKSGYLGANMDEIAALSGVSKQTVYKQFTSKEALFTEVVSAMTNATGDLVHRDALRLESPRALAAWLEDYALRQLRIVVTPRVMQLRRLVIAEVGRFPDLARVLYERGPQRAIGILGEIFAELAAAGHLRVEDARAAAIHFNWLVMGEAINRAMLLGDAGLGSEAEMRAQAKGAVAVFLRAYGNAVAGPRPSTRSG